MKKIATWVVPSLLAMTAVVWASACTTSEDPALTPDVDAGSEKDASQGDPGDSSTGDSSTGDADVGGEGGVIDAHMKACARIDACAATGTAKIGMNGCYSLITAKPFERGLGPKERAQLENLECKLAAKTCAEVQACDKPLADYTALCREKEGGEHCVNGVHVVCDADATGEFFVPVANVDCTAMGQICGGDEFGSYAGCGLAPCVPGESASTCNGSILTQCMGYGATKEIDCKTANDVRFVKPAGKKTVASTACGLNIIDENACIADGAECTGFAERCDGTVLETCTMGKLARRDCATVQPAGQGCVVLADGPDYIQGMYGCGPVNPTCHETDNETCNASTGVIGFCALTGPKTLDCKALGYAGCKTTTADGRVTAACFQ